jgi:PhzF family phenazine biosynthesis protein
MNRYFFADVFADRPLTGNPVVVVPDADDLGEVRMRAMAREFNQCETTFVLRPGRPGADWRLRSFTPIGAEVFGAGHNGLGAWLWPAGDGRLPAGRTAFTQPIGDDLRSAVATAGWRGPGQRTPVVTAVRTAGASLRRPGPRTPR